MRSFYLFLLTAFFFSQQAFAQEDFSHPLSWRTLVSENFRVEYTKGSKAQAEETVKIAEEVLIKLSAKFNWTPWFRVHIALNQQEDSPNGYATPLPFNRSVIYIAKPSSFNELVDYNDWLADLLIHELTHIIHLDKGHKAVKAMRFGLGRNPLLFPNAYQPNFFKEGLATYIETNWQQGTGRGQGAYYQMMMRQEVDRGVLNLDEAQQPRREWPLNHAYLYGVYFFQFIDDVYGPEAIDKYIASYSDNIIPFLVNGSARHASSNDANGLTDLWGKYQQWLNRYFEHQIESIKSAGVTEKTLVTKSGYFNSNPIAGHNNDIYFISFDVHHPSYLVRYDIESKKQKKLKRIKASSELIGLIGSNLYYLQSSSCKHNQKTFELYRYDIKKKRNKRLTHCARYVQATVNSKHEVFAVKENNGFKELISYSIKEKTETMLYRGAADESFSTPAWHEASNKILISKKIKNKPWGLYWFNLADNSFTTFIQSEKIAYYLPIIDQKNNVIYATSDKGQQLDIYRFDLEGSQSRITRSLGGSVISDIDSDNNRILFNSYEKDGWHIAFSDAKIIDETAISQLEKPGQSFDVEWDFEKEVPFDDTAYNPIISMWPRTWSFAAYNSGLSTELGLTVSGRDALNFHQYLIGAAYDSENEVSSGIFQYIFFNHVAFTAGRYYDFTEGNGLYDEENIEEERIDFQAAMFYYSWPFNFSYLSFFTGAIATQKTFTDLINETELAADDINTYGAGFIYDSTTTTLESISESFGRKIKVTYEADEREVIANNLTALDNDGASLYTIDWREFIHLYKAHTLVLRAFYGKGEEGIEPFELAGDNSNIFSVKPLIFDRRQSLRAYPNKSPELVGDKAVIYAAEYRLPIAFINEGISSWPVGFYDVSANLFYEEGAACYNCKDFEYFTGQGLELTLRMDLGYGLLPLSIAAGIAQPNEATLKNEDKDLHAYFRLNSSF